MRMIVAALLLTVTSTLTAQDSGPNSAPWGDVEPDEKGLKNLPEDASPLLIHKMVRTKPYQRLYSVSPKEVDNLLTNGVGDSTYRYVEPLGYGSNKPGKGLTKIFRVWHNGFLTFYTKAPDKLNPKATPHHFPVWVWEKKADGLVPVYACSHPNWTDMVFSTDKKVIDRAIEDAWKFRRAKRKNHGVMFYIIPVKKNEDSKQGDAPASDDESVKAERDAVKEKEKTDNPDPKEIKSE